MRNRLPRSAHRWSVHASWERRLHEGGQSLQCNPGRTEDGSCSSSSQGAARLPASRTCRVGFGPANPSQQPILSPANPLPARSRLALTFLDVEALWRQRRWFPALWTYCFCFALLEIYLDMLMSTFHPRQREPGPFTCRHLNSLTWQGSL